MFDISAIEMFNFKSFHDLHSFEFPTEPGLYHLTGSNLFNPRLDREGVGKTTLLDAIQWVCYGRTTRGLRASDVITWGEKHCWVSIILSIAEDTYKLSRSQNPNKIMINGDTVDQNEVDNLLRINQAAFNYAVITPQFGESFFDLSPTEKLTLFTKIMDLDYWLDKSKTAQTVSDKLKTKISNLELELANLRGTRENIKSSISELSDKSSAFEEEAKEKAKRLKKDLKDLKPQQAELENKRESFKGREKSAVEEVKEIEEAIANIQDEEKTYIRRIQKLTSNIQYKEKEVSKLQSEIEAISNLSGTECPKCKQPVGKKHTQEIKNELESRIAELQQEVLSLKKKYKKASKSCEDLDEELSTLKSDLGEARQKADGIHDKVSSLDYKLKLLDSEEKGIQKDLDNLRSQSNPFEKMIHDKTTELRDTKKRIKKVRSNLTELNEENEAVSYWINGFKQVRLYLVEEALHTLEVEINNNLESLGLTDWQITLDVERENKSGGVTKGFSVFVVSPKHDQPVPWAAWSGGETQRLRLAGNLSVANLIYNRAGLTGQIEFYDEPTKHMAQSGITDMLEILHTRAVELERKVWIVDHSALNFGAFAGTLTAVMTKEGSSELEYAT